MAAGKSVKLGDQARVICIDVRHTHLARWAWCPRPIPGPSLLHRGSPNAGVGDELADHRGSPPWLNQIRERRVAAQRLEVHRMAVNEVVATLGDRLAQ